MYWLKTSGCNDKAIKNFKIETNFSSVDVSLRLRICVQKNIAELFCYEFAICLILSH